MSQKRKLRSATIKKEIKMEEITSEDDGSEEDIVEPKKMKLEKKSTIKKVLSTSKKVQSKPKKESKPVKLKIKAVPSKLKLETGYNYGWLDEQLLAEKANLNKNIAHSIIKLFEAGNTIPFIARYRQHLTAHMNPENLRYTKEFYDEIITIKMKIQTIIKALEKNGHLTEELKTSILNCRTLHELEHIYAPFKQTGQRTLAERAKSLGLEGPAQALLNGTQPVNIETLTHNIGTEVETHLVHLIAHYIATNNEFLIFLRDIKNDFNFKLESKQSASVKKNECPDMYKFEQYFNFSIPVKYIKPHQTLAINRGENLKILSVKIIVPEALYYKFIYFCDHKWLNNTDKSPNRVRIFRKACEDSYKRLILPFLRRQTMSSITKEAEKASIIVFGENLKNLLLTTPIKGKIIMGIDPGYQLGCKVGVISQFGDVLDTAVIYPHIRKSYEDKNIIINLLKKHCCTLIALGNGKACRETETWLTELFKSEALSDLDINYTIVDESGASVYSCSDAAKEEFPDLDPLEISAISLARRIQDPLAELVKVEPRSLGVGMYQHDINKKSLEDTLDDIISECVSFVGVDINTASISLLKRVAGLSAQKADNIIKHRIENGPFTNRYQLKDVKGIGDKIFEQCAGFIRVGPANAQEAKEYYTRPETMPLDCTWIHPESYDIAEKLIEKFGLFYKNIGQPDFIKNMKEIAPKYSAKSLANEFNTTEETITLILETLQRSLDHDIRKECDNTPLFQKGITGIEDVRLGIILTGRVTNVVHFGAFVDIGVGQNGLIHNKNMNNLKVGLGNRVEVRVVNFEKGRMRIGLQLLKIL